MKSLPNYLQFDQYEGTPLRSIFTAAGRDALDLLDLMLKYDPLKRPTTETILRHEYFMNMPRPTKPSKLPRDISENEDAGKSKRKLAFEDNVDKSVRVKLW
jgi:cyclin-dependent kinase 7